MLTTPKRRPRQQPFRKGESKLKYQYNREEALARIQLEEALAAQKRAEAANNSSFNLSANTVMSAMTLLSNETPFTGQEYLQAAEDLRLQKVETWHDINKGFEAAIMAQLGTDLAYPLLKGGFKWLRNKAISPAARLMMNPLNFVFEGPKIKPAQINLLPETAPEEIFAMRLVEPLLKKPLLELPQPKLQLSLPAYNIEAKLNIPKQDAGLADITDGDLFGIKLADTALKRPITVTPHDMPSNLFENLGGNSAESAANNLYQQYIENLPFWQSHGVRPPLPYITSVGDESLSVGFRPQWYKMIGTPNTLQKVAELPAGLPESVAIKRLPEPARNQLDNMMGNGIDFDLFDEWLGPEAMSQSQLENRALATQAFNDIADRARFDVNVNTLKENGLISGRHAAALKHAEDPSKYWSWGVEKSALKKAVPQYFKDIKLAKQKDYARRVIDARKLEESVNAGLNDRANAVYSDLQGSIKPPQSLNSLINDANQTIGLIRSIGDIVEDTFNNYLTWKVNPNPAGWQLKYLMQGNKLERQLSKDGTISINAINDLVKSGSDIEKYVTEKVLNEKFAGQSKINYTDFKHAVQDELVNYRTEQTHGYEDYGINRLGYDQIGVYNRGSITVDDLQRNFPGRFVTSRDPLFKVTDKETGKVLSTQEDLDEYVDLLNNNKVLLDTYTFSSPRIPKGNMNHYQMNTLGHSRTFVSKEDPDVMYVMESLSDWGLKGRNTGHYETDMNPYGSKTDPLTPHEKYLMKNWESRLIQENIMHAADKGLTKMRYPTEETAAKIEGYSPVPTLRPVSDEELNELIKLDDIINSAKDKPDITQFEGTGSGIDDYYRALNNWRENNPTIVEAENKASSIRSRMFVDDYGNTVIADPDILTYRPEHLTILKKYSEFPKKFKKIYKNAEVREVTDAKGNTWYEVDVPKDMSKRERAYSIVGTAIAGGTAAATLKPLKKNDVQ